MDFGYLKPYLIDYKSQKIYHVTFRLIFQIFFMYRNKREKKKENKYLGTISTQKLLKIALHENGISAEEQQMKTKQLKLEI